MLKENKPLSKIYPRRLEIPVLILVSIALLAAGLSLPILIVKQLWIFKNTFSILTGIQALWVEKYYLLAIVIAAFSIVFPIIKLASLILIWFLPLSKELRQRILTWLEILGKWSMLDVFVVAVTIVVVKLGVIASAQPQTGLYCFALAIITSMAVTAWISFLHKKSTPTT